MFLTAVVLLVAAVQDKPASPRPGPLPAAGAESHGVDSRLLLGLQAYRAEEMADAVALLNEPAGQMEDWRLLVLAEGANALQDPSTAEEALSTLINLHPNSPIRALAIQRAAQIAVENELWDSALRWIDFAHGESLPRDKSKEIEVLEWELGATLVRPDLQSQAGRHLLVEHPLEADELEVQLFFQNSSGRLDWNQLLNHTELGLRAHRQIEGRKSEDALDTLDLVPAEQRDFDWSLLRAEALTRDNRGREALDLLTKLDSSDVDRQTAIAWQRALAARDASRVRRGRSNLPQSQREEMRALSQMSLNKVAALTTDQELQLRALQMLFTLVSDEDDSFDASLAVLQRLQGLDPTDTTGTRYLWRLGWQAYTQRDYPVAIGYWSELESMYPGTNNARSARYWTGRAHESLGHGTRASDIYREILAAEADDFYSRHARSRLGESTEPALEIPDRPTEPWPEDPLLERARWLNDLGLAELALHELDGQQAAADRRAFCAEKAVVLANLDQRRDSIQSLACAFAALGKAHQGLVPKEALRLYYPLDFRQIIEQRAEEQKLSAYLVFAMVRQESAFDSQARSWAGARGLMQLMPATGKEVAQRLGLRYSIDKLNDPDFSIQLGTRYFRQVLDMFEGNEELALAGYNGGPYRIKKLWRQAGSNAELDRFVEGLSLEETKTYVKRILLFEDSYHRLYSAGG